MEHRFLTIEQFNELINQWNGKNIQISKMEMDDFDETLMELEQISYDKNPNSMDDYEAMYTLQFNGVGKVMTEGNDFQQLPSSIYEIPLQDTTLYEFDGTEFLLSTDRGVYKIRLA